MTLDTATLHDHWTHVFTYVRKRLEGQDTAVAEDLTADTFERAIRGAASYHETGKGPRNWLLTIAQRIVFDWYRKQQYRGIEPLEIVDFARGHLDAGSGQHDAMIDVRAAFDLLPSAQRDILWRRAVEGVQFKYLGDRSKTTAYRHYQEGAAAMRTLVLSGRLGSGDTSAEGGAR